MKNLQNALEEVTEILETVNAEFYDEDGSHYGAGPMAEKWNGSRWLEWINMAEDACGFEWSNDNKIKAARMLGN